MPTDETKAKLLAASTRLFARRGFAGVSTRQLAKEAGVNLQAINYHFGTKEELFKATLAQFFDQIIDERYARLAACEEAAADRPPSLESILRALIEPHVQLVGRPGGRDYLRIYSQLGSAPQTVVAQLYQDEILPARVRFIDALGRAEPRLRRDTLEQAFSVIATNLVTTMFEPGYEVMTGKHMASLPAEELSELLVTYNAAGLRRLAERDAADRGQRARTPSRRAGKARRGS